MQKIILVLTIVLATFGSSYGQKTNNAYLEFGGVRSSFQDLKYSAVRYNGFGGLLNIGFESTSPSRIWGYSLNLLGASESAKTFDFGQTLVIAPMIQFKYLRGINDQLYIGGKWDIINGTYRNVAGLGNNGNYTLASSNLFASGVYKLNKFEFGLDLALLSLVKEGTGFAFSAPQKGLEEGAFDYQNQSLSNPFPISYTSVRAPNRHFFIRTNIKYNLSKRFSLNYNWTMKKYIEVKKYGATSGASTLSIRWNLTNKEKDAAKS